MISRNTANKVMDILIAASGLTILAGVFFRIQHYSFGNLTIWIGFIAQMLFSTIEIARLKRIIKTMETKGKK